MEEYKIIIALALIIVAIIFTVSIVRAVSKLEYKEEQYPDLADMIRCEDFDIFDEIPISISPEGIIKIESEGYKLQNYSRYGKFIFFSLYGSSHLYFFNPDKEVEDNKRVVMKVKDISYNYYGSYRPAINRLLSEWKQEEVK